MIALAYRAIIDLLYENTAIYTNGCDEPRRTSPAISESRKSTTKTKNKIFAMDAAPAAIPPKPKTAAMIATMKNASAQLNMIVSFTVTVLN